MENNAGRALCTSTVWDTRPAAVRWGICTQYSEEHIDKFSPTKPDKARNAPLPVSISGLKNRSPVPTLNLCGAFGPESWLTTLRLFDATISI
jgi:hypothetical protein